MQFLFKKIVDHPTNIKLNNKNKILLKDSKYLEINFDIEQLLNDGTNLYLTDNYTILNKSEKLSLFVDREVTSKYSFNYFKYEINFDTHQIITDFLKYTKLYCNNCIKLKVIFNKNKIFNNTENNY